jgi:hypothetical protein
LVCSCAHLFHKPPPQKKYSGGYLDNIIESKLLILFFSQYYDGITFDYHETFDIYKNEIVWFEDILRKYYEGEIIYDDSVNSRG